MKSRNSAVALAAAAALLPALAEAQTPYVVADSIGTWTELTGGNTHVPVPYSFFGAWDEGSVAIPLPFTFTWYGDNYTTIHAYTNGFVGFSGPPVNAGLLGAPAVVPSTANAIHNFIGVMWSDLDGPPGAEIRSQTTGVAGSRVFTIQLANFQDFGNTLSSVNFQVRLYEGTSAIELVMGPNALVTGGATAFENANGTEGMNILSCAPGACGSTQWQPAGRTFTITLPAGPELTGEVLGPRGAYPGSTFDATVRLRNLGLTDSGPFSYRLFLSSSATSTQAATLLAEVAVPAGVPASTTLEEVQSLVMPPGLPPASYLLALAIDPYADVDEVIEGNNLVFDVRGIATAPDLTTTVAAPSTSGPGETMSLTVGVDSIGAPVATPILVSFFLSVDELIDGSDFPLGSTLVTLADGFTTTESIDVTVPENVPPSPPTYRVIARVDDQNTVAEINESNNTAASPGAVTLDGPDLEATDITAGPNAFRGEPYAVSATIENNGGATARDFTVCVIASRNLLISVISDPILVETAPMTLLPGETARLDLAPIIDANTSTGTWYLAAVADCSGRVLEALETDNTRRRVDPITIRDPAPDFAISEIATATAAASGETVPVAVRIANLGNLAGATSVRLVLSTNPGITLDDPQILETQAPVSLAPGEESTIAVWAPLPGDLSSGTYWIGAIVDPLGLTEEVFEDNNAQGAGPVALSGSDLAIISPPPPPAMIGVRWVRRFNAAGGTQPYTWSITWEDDRAPAGLAFDDALGELAGTPAAGAEGRYDFSVRVSSGGLAATRDYSLLVTQPTIPLEVVSSRLPPALLDEAYTVQLIAVGGSPPYQWAIDADGPPGLGLSASGELGGEPQLVGAFTFGVSVSDVAGTISRATLVIDVLDASSTLSITTADVARADLGLYYEETFAAAGGTPPYTWSFERTAPIPGLEFLADTAQLVGTPTIAGEYAFLVQVTDAKGLFDRNAYVLEVLPPGDLVITTGQSPDTQLPAGLVGAPYLDDDGTSVRLRAVRRAGGSLAELTWAVVDGELPPGLALSPDGAVTGTPTAGGRFPFRVLVTNPQGDFAFTALAIEILEPEGPAPRPLDDGCSCNATGDAGTARGGSLLFAALAFALVAGRRAGRSRVRARRAGSAAVLLAVLLGAGPASAQIIPYQVLSSTAPYEQLGPGALQIFPGLGDANTAQIPLGFDFYLYGVATDTIWVNANGLVATTNIRAGHHYPPQFVPNPAAVTGWVAGLWDDWCASPDCSGPSPAGIGIFYEVDSTPGAGRVTIEFRHIRHYSDSTQASDLNFQITLHEGLSSKVELAYGPMTQGLDFFGGPTPYHARIGLQNEAGTEGMFIAPCAGGVACSFAELAALTDQRLTLIADAGEDLAVSTVSVPATGYPGLPLPFTTRLVSRHQDPLGPTQLAAYLVPATETSTAAGVRIFTSDPLTLAGFETRVIDAEGEVPSNLPIGQYRVVVVADDLHALAEPDEQNNVARSLTIVRIAERAPDFRVLRVSPLQSTVSPGQTLDVVYTVDNFGNEPGRLTGQLYLSTNNAITTSDLPFGAALSFDSVSRQTFTGTVSVVVPASITTGSYYVGAILDPELQVAELSESNNVGRGPQPVVISASSVAVLTEALPPATIGLAYSATVRATGGNGELTYRLSNGVLPRGVTFNADAAEIFGIPLEAGSFPLEIEARSGALTAKKTLPLEVLDPTWPITFVSRDLPPAVLGQDYAVTIQVVGGVAPYTRRISSGSLPDGIFLGTDGTLVGTPRSVGFSTFDLEVKDNGSEVAVITLGLEVRSPGNLSITSAQLPEAELGESYMQRLFATGGIPPITWRAIRTGLILRDPPPGLEVLQDGTFSGIPEVAGRFHFSVEATDARGNVDTNQLSIEVMAVGRFDIATTALPQGTPGTAYRASISGQGGTLPYTWEIVVKEGALPPGFEADTERGAGGADDLVITGLAEREGLWTFTVRLHDAAGRSVDRPFVIVTRAPPPPPPVVEDPGCTCVSARPVTPQLDGSGGALVLLLSSCVLLLSRRRSRTTPNPVGPRLGR